MTALPASIPTPRRPFMRLVPTDRPALADVVGRLPLESPHLCGKTRPEAIAGMSGEELLMLRAVGGRMPRLKGARVYGELVRAGYELAAEGVPRGGFIRKVRRTC